jgi:hypothetical protein
MIAFKICSLCKGERQFPMTDFIPNPLLMGIKFDCPACEGTGLLPIPPLQVIGVEIAHHSQVPVRPTISKERTLI